MEIISRNESEQKLITQFWEFLDGSKSSNATGKFVDSIRKFALISQGTNPFIYEFGCGSQTCDGHCSEKCSLKYRIRGYTFNLTDKNSVEDLKVQVFDFLKCFKEFNNEDNVDMFIEDLLESPDLPECFREYVNSKKFMNYLREIWVVVFDHEM